MSGAYQSEVGDAGLAGLGVFVEHEDVPVDELEVGVGLRAHVVGVLAFGDAEVGDDELDDDEVFRFFELCIELSDFIFRAVEFECGEREATRFVFRFHIEIFLHE